MINVIVAQLLYLSSIDDETFLYILIVQMENVHFGYAIYDTMHYITPNI